MDREEFTSFYTATFQRLVGQLYAMTGDQADRATRFDRRADSGPGRVH